jgi:hypothetical protein
MSCLYSVKCIVTTPTLNGHADLVLWLPKDRYLGNLTNLTNFATRITIQQSTFMESYDYVLCSMYGEKCIRMIIYTQQMIGWTKTMPAKCHCSVLLEKMQGCALQRTIYFYTYIGVCISMMMSLVRRDKTPQYKYQQCPPMMHIQKPHDCAPNSHTCLAKEKSGKAVYTMLHNGQDRPLSQHWNRAYEAQDLWPIHFTRCASHWITLQQDKRQKSSSDKVKEHAVLL